MARPAEATAVLRSLLGRGLGIVPVEHIGFDHATWVDPAFTAVREQLTAEDVATPTSPVWRTLSDPQLIPEGIAWDPKRRMHYVGSIHKKKVIAVDAQGRVRDFSRAADRLDAVIGMAVDTRRDRLCAVSTNGFEQLPAGAPRRNAVVCWPLAGRAPAERIDLPDARQLNDLTFAPDGTLYTTDSLEGSLWRLRPGSRTPERIGEPGGLRGANGVAVAPDGIVYVALNTGIARIDVARDEAMRLPQPDTLVSGGIDGLYWHQGDLVGVQNVSNPGRVIRLALGEGGRRITGLTVLQSRHHPQFNEPTTGTIVGDTLHVVANSHIAQLQPDRSLKDPGALRPTAIVAVPLRR